MSIDDRDDLPRELVVRLAQLDTLLPERRAWRAAARLDARPSDGAARAQGERRVRASSGLRGAPVGTMLAGALVLVAIVAAVAVGPSIAPTSGSGAPDGRGATGSTSVPAVLEPSVTPPSAATPTPRPSLALARLRLIDTTSSIERTLADQLGWACLARRDAPAPPEVPMLDKVLLIRPSRTGLTKLPGGQIVWLGGKLEPAAIGFGASLLLRDGDGRMWILVKGTPPTVRQLASLTATDGSVAWWLGASLTDVACPQPSSAPGGRPPAR